MENSTGSRRKNKTRQDILDAAYQMITLNGVEGLSLRAVAERIDYSPAALYRYFASKEDLVDAVRAQCFERLNTAILASFGDRTSPANQLLAAGLAYIRFAREHPVDYYLMFHLHASPATQGENQPVAMAGLIHLVRYGLETGVFTRSDDFDETAIAYYCWATVHGLAMLETTVMKDEEPSVARVSEAILRRMIASLSSAS